MYQSKSEKKKKKKRKKEVHIPVRKMENINLKVKGGTFLSPIFSTSPFKCNLISVRDLTTHGCYPIHYEQDRSEIAFVKKKSFLMQARWNNGAYILAIDPIKTLTLKTGSQFTLRNTSVQKASDITLLWHRR